MQLNNLTKVKIAFFLIFHSLAAFAAETTVIFEAGFGTTSEVWKPVIKLLPDNIKVINETRASLLAKDAKPTTLHHDITVMNDRVKRASRQGNIIVVGHSYGGLVVTEMLKENKSYIDGIVLIEPTTAVHRVRFKALNTERVNLDDQLIAKYMPPHLRPHYKILTDELDGAKPELQPLPADLPTILFTSTKVHSEPLFFEETAVGKSLWLQLHNELFQNVRKGQHIRSDEWGHTVHAEAPDAVAKAIINLVDILSDESEQNISKG